MKNVIIVNSEDLKKKISKFKEQGKDKIHVLSDFDRTLTKAFVNGEKASSIIAILRNENYLVEDYAEKAHALFDKYHPIEIDSSISLNEKKKKMKEWWMKHFELLIKSKLNKKDIENVINSKNLVLRKGVDDFFNILDKNNISLIILSSAGLGGESIKMVLDKNNLLFSNVDVISNSFKWDEKGNAIGINEPIVHVFNKDETSLPDNIYEKVKDRKNVILIGDSLGDLGMIGDFEYSEIIKIGFFNYGDEKDLAKYKEEFDIVVLNDGDFGYINELFAKILG